MENEEIEYVEGSIAEDLSKAFDEVAEKPEEPVAEVETEVKAEKEPEPVEVAEVVEEDDVPRGTIDTEKPPSSLSPAAREAWKDVPDAVRAEVAKREKDYEAGIMKYAENAKRAQQMDNSLQPFQQYIAMTGQPPAEVVGSLLQTASLLQMGSPVQRAQKVAELISQFGVDIATLDSILSGGQPPEPDQNYYVQQAIQQAVQPYQQFMTQFEQQQKALEQQRTGQIGSELEQFAAKNEFYTDVREDMADILDLASKRSVNMSLDEAYRRACLLNPEISQILETRGKQPTASQKRAASSIRGGSPGGTTVEDDSGSLRDTIAKAWDIAGRG